MGWGFVWALAWKGYRDWDLDWDVGLYGDCVWWLGLGYGWVLGLERGLGLRLRRVLCLGRVLGLGLKITLELPFGFLINVGLVDLKKIWPN